MYAQLCKRLSDEAPNFEPEDRPCTFRLLLLNKCRAEFENRAQAFAAYEERRPLTPEDEERRHIAKCKMLGNIKFIGELGKLEILSESTLHRCIQSLLARRATADRHEDLECLAQLVRTCGRVLDSERGRRLMDQYFARIDALSRSPELAPRIRFMLRDVAELRRGGWVPRAAIASEPPVPIQQLRNDDDEPPRRMMQPHEPLFRRKRPLDDVLAGLSLGPAPSPAPQPRQPSLRTRPQPTQSAPPPRRRLPATAPPIEDVQMRPAANSLMFTANKHRPQPPAHTPLPATLAPAAFAPAAAPLLKEPAIAIKPAPDKKEKAKKDKGPNKEELNRLCEEMSKSVCEAFTSEEASRDECVSAAADKLATAIGGGEKALRRAVVALLGHAANGQAEEAHCWAAVALSGAIKRTALNDALRETLRERHPHASLPHLVAQSVAQKMLPLSEAWALTDDGAHYPLLLDVLQRLAALVGVEELRRLYDEAKLNVVGYVRSAGGEADADAAAAAALDARGLAALVPQLRLQAEFARQLTRDSSPSALYRFIKTQVEAGVRSHPSFVAALLGRLADHLTRAAAGESSREEALLEAYAPLLSALLAGRPELQLAAVYALQLHAHKHGYPRGMLLRWFMYLYDMEVCEEDAFLRWREDVTDAYPGKGEALFQVNTWLTWLQQQESEEEKDDEDN